LLEGLVALLKLGSLCGVHNCGALCGVHNCEVKRVPRIPVYFKHSSAISADCCNDLTQLPSIYHLSTLIYLLQFWLITIALHWLGSNKHNLGTRPSENRKEGLAEVDPAYFRSP